MRLLCPNCERYIYVSKTIDMRVNYNISLCSNTTARITKVKSVYVEGLSGIFDLESLNGDKFYCDNCHKTFDDVYSLSCKCSFCNVAYPLKELTFDANLGIICNSCRQQSNVYDFINAFCEYPNTYLNLERRLFDDQNIDDQNVEHTEMQEFRVINSDDTHTA